MNPDAIAPTVASINGQVGAINSETGSSLPTISIAKLTGPQPNPITPIAPAPALQGPALASVIGTNADTYAKDLQTKADAAAATKSTSLSDLEAAIAASSGVAQRTNEAYTTTVDPAQAELSKINNDIIAEKTATAHQIEALKANPNGAFGTGLQQTIDDINSKSLSRQADLSVIQMAKQGQYDSAKAIADRAVAAATEAQKNKIDALQVSFDNNKSEFSDAEQKAFTAAQADRAAALDTYKTEKTAINTLAIDALKNGAPTSVAQAIQSAATLKDAEGAAGVYGATPTVRNGGNGSSTFTKSQVNNGAQNAGVDAATFKTLDTDVQNFYVNAPQKTVDAVANVLSQVASGSQTADDANKWIDASNITDTMKTYLKDKVATATKGQSSGGFLSGLGSDISGGINSVRSFLGI